MLLRMFLPAKGRTGFGDEKQILLQEVGAGSCLQENQLH